MVQFFLALFLSSPASVAHPSMGATAADCAQCHQAEFAQWRESRHAGARTNAVFSASFTHFPHPWCLSCHQPQGIAEDGVSCLSCHPKSNQAPLPDPICATCHEFNFQNHTPAAPFTLSHNPAQQTVSEWRGSAAAQAGITCTDCHMGEHGHRFAGAHTPSMVRDLLKVDVVRLSDTIVRATISAPGAAHRVPTGDPFRRIEVRICEDQACERLVVMKSLRRVIVADETSWFLGEDRTIPPETATTQAVRVLDLPVNANARWWRLDYRYGDARFEADLPEHAVGYLIAQGPVKPP